MRSESSERVEDKTVDHESPGHREVIASVVGSHDDNEVAYSMYEARGLSPDGVFLAGSLFLELNEEFTVELILGDARLRTRARVTAVERGAAPGMAVVFANLSDSDRALLEREAGRATQD